MTPKTTLNTTINYSKIMMSAEYKHFYSSTKLQQHYIKTIKEMLN